MSARNHLDQTLTPGFAMNPQVKMPRDLQMAVFPSYLSKEDAKNARLGILPVVSSTALPSQQQLFTLLSLPNELLVAIAELVGCATPNPNFGEYECDPYEPGPKDVLHLALSCRRLFGLTEPVLYSYYRDIAPERQTPGVSESMQKFVCRILARPDLGAHVRVIHLNALNADDVQRASCIGEHDMARIETAVEKANNSKQEATSLLFAIESGVWDAFLVLLLTLCAKVEELILDSWTDRNPDYPFLMVYLSRAANLQKNLERTHLSLSNLRSVVLDSQQSGRLAIHPHQTLQFLKLKSVQNLRAGMLMDEYVYESGNDEEDASGLWGPGEWPQSSHSHFPPKLSASIIATFMTTVSKTSSRVSHI